MTNVQSPQTEGKDREIVMTRVFDAPREMVWRAWTESDQIAQWWGPRGFTTRVEQHEFHPGGTFRYVMVGPDGKEYPCKGIFQEIVPMRRIVATDEWPEEFKHMDPADLPAGMVSTFIFESIDDKQTRLIVRINHPTAEDRLKHEKMGVVEGFGTMLDCLADHLASQCVPGAAELELVITRTFDAPRTLVWQAWTQPRHMAQWMHCDACSPGVAECDLTPGGKWRVTMHTSDGRELVAHGVYHEINPPSRLVFTHRWLNNDELPDVDTLVTVTFAERDGRTEMTFKQTGFATAASRDAHEGGWCGAFAQLADLLPVFAKGV